MTISNQTSERLFPFYLLLASLTILAVYSSVSAASSLTGVTAICFWILEMGMLTGALLVACPYFNWPERSWNNFALKTTLVAAIASFILAVPSVLLDIAFGIVRLEQVRRLSELDLASCLGAEYGQEVLILFVPCLLIITVVNWFKRAGPFGTSEFGTPKFEVPSVVSEPHSTMHEIQFRPQFWDKLQRRRHGHLLALEAQEHYILVHTTVGTELVHYRFGEAVKELKGREGAQVHRSFWVARSAIRDVIVEGRNSYAILTSGAEVPISRRRKQDALAQFAP